MLVYRCTNLISGKVYIGKTTATLRRRWSEHCSAARRGSPYLFHRAIRKYGPDAFQVEALVVASYPETLNALEQECIAQAGSLVPGGYNLRPGGEGGTHSHQTRRILRERALGRRLSAEHRAAIGRGITGERNGFYGKHHSEETKQVLRTKCASVCVGVPLTPEHRERISSALTGRARTPEHTQHLREALTGKRRSPEQREQMSQARRGKPKPPGHGANVSAALKGRPKSPEHRQKLREAALKRAEAKRELSCKI
jgi:group I intron endonuclease